MVINTIFHYSEISIILLIILSISKMENSTVQTKECKSSDHEGDKILPVTRFYTGRGICKECFCVQQKQRRLSKAKKASNESSSEKTIIGDSSGLGSSVSTAKLYETLFSLNEKVSPIENIPASMNEIVESIFRMSIELAQVKSLLLSKSTDKD